VFRLAGGAATYSTAEALDAVREYAFGTVMIDPDRRFPRPFASHTVPRYAYRTYDCVPASDGARFSDLDLLVTAGPGCPGTGPLLVLSAGLPRRD
jgi:hypothetical protein